ncbi:glycosyltransferase family 2 protein [Shewanella mangrovisoli]|uniref:glycosyltransferase family 2 protein n=1 Tax=Shewanella mangrovisoli TaxID=2864211 RepID=UPI0035BA4118
MHDGRPVASLIILTYNQKDFIEQAILSALNQNASFEFEVIVADDCSVDGTWEKVSELACVYHFKKIRTSVNSGVVSNLNNAFNLAEGDYIFLMGGDDISHSERLSYLVEYFYKNLDTYCIYSNTFDMNFDGRVLTNKPSGYRYHLRNGDMTIKSFLENDLGVLGCSAAYRREVFVNFGDLNKGLPSEDKVLTLRALILGDVHYVSVPLVYYRLGVGVSNNTSIRSKYNYVKLLNGKLNTYKGYLNDGAVSAIQSEEILIIKHYIDFFTMALSLFQEFSICEFFKLLVSRVNLREKARFLFYFLRLSK